MSSRGPILIVGQALQNTGLARVTRALARHLARHYDVHVLGIDCFAGRGGTSGGEGWTLHENPASYDWYAEHRLTTLVDEIRPAVVLLYHDLWVISRYYEPLARARHRSAVVGYCPIDGLIGERTRVAPLAQLDALVVFTEFARATVLQSAWREHLAAAEPFRSVRVIPHGLDAETFFPWPGDDHDRRLRARQTLFPDRPDLWDGFWILNANRNQPRKRLDLTLEGFARFAAGKPANVRLYLHTGLQEVGIDVMRQADLLGIEERLVLSSGGTDDHPTSSIETLNAIYNACDVGVNTATGEGWGLVACEHAATRAAQVVPNHSACGEIWNGAAELMPCTPVRMNDFFDGAAIDPAALANSLERLYADETYRQSMANAAYERITTPEFRWERIAEQWSELCAELLCLNDIQKRSEGGPP